MASNLLRFIGELLSLRQSLINGDEQLKLITSTFFNWLRCVNGTRLKGTQVENATIVSFMLRNIMYVIVCLFILMVAFSVRCLFNTIRVNMCVAGASGHEMYLYDASASASGPMVNTNQP